MWYGFPLVAVNSVVCVLVVLGAVARAAQNRERALEAEWAKRE